MVGTLGNNNYVTSSDGIYIDNVMVYNYKTPGYYDSATSTVPGYIISITPTWTSTLNSQTLTMRVSRDGGTTWITPTSGVEYAFTNNEPRGKNLRYNFTMSTSDVRYTPVLHDVTISYKYCYRGVTFTGESSGDRFGFSVHGAGNVGAGLTGDSGIDDIIIGAPYRSSGAGAVYIFNGSTSLSGTISAANAAYIKDGPAAGAHFGWSVCEAGDVDNDGYNDVIVGAPDRDRTTPSLTDSGWAQILVVIIPVPEFSAAMMAILPPIVGVPLIVYRRKRKSLSYVGSTTEVGSQSL
jgi:hypothetical protein